MPNKYTTEERIEVFWSRVDKSGGDDACWIWTGSCIKSGYGSVNWSGKIQPVHRISYQLLYGDIPEGLWVLHHCDVRNCVNPRHLFLGTVQDNVDDMFAKGRGRKASGEQHGAHLHPERWLRGTDVALAKLTEADVILARQRFAEGNITKLQLSREYQVSDTAMCKVLNRKTWKHIP